MKLYFKINERLKKIFNYFSIFTIVLGTTFGSLNSAYAANVGAALTVDDAEATDIDFNVDEGNLTITTEPGADPAVTAVIVGDITDSAETADIILLSDALDLTAPTFVINSVVIDDATAPGVVTITDTDGSVGDMTVTVSGIFNIDGALTVTNAEDTDAETLTVNFDGATTVTGATEIDADSAGSAVATNINIKISDDATFTGGVDLGDIAGTNTSTLTIDGAAAQTIAGAIDGEGAGEGTISVTNTGGTVTFTGVIGGTDIASVTTAVNTTSVFEKAVDTVSLTQAGTATFSKAVGGITGTATLTGNTTFSEALTAATVDINSGTQTFTGAVTAATTIDVAGASTIVNIDAATAAANLTLAAGTINVSVDDSVIDDLIMSGGDIVVEKTVTNGQTVFKANTQLDTLTGGEIYMPVNLSNGQTLILIEDTDGSAVAALEEDDVEGVVVDTALTNYVASEAAFNVVVTSTDKASSSTASELGVTENDAKALLQLRNAAISDANSDGDAEDAVFNALNAKGGFSATEDTNLAKQAAPQTDMISGSTFATKAMTGSLQGIMSNRMAALRSGEAYYGSGMSAGANMSANSGFLQVFGTDAEQKNKTVGSGTQFGYDASSAGIALGFDGITDNGSVVGLSLSMSETDVDGKGTGKSKNDIDSYTASIYMDKSTDAGYVEGSLTVGLNENNSSRIVNTAGLDRTYKGDYDSEQVSLKIGGGKPNAVGMSGYVTPFGSITATRISTDAYTESSTTANDNLRLRVAQDDVDSVVGTVGLKYHNVLDNGGSPMISLAINNEFGDSTINSTNTYQGGGSSFKTSTDVEELSATLGLGYSFSSDNASIEFAYEADANDDDYLSHYGSIKLVGKF
jgi:uncharacterized protein with beta-barrel porin domain